MKHNVFYNYQFGFLPGRSPSHALLHLSDMIMNAFEKRHFVSGTFVDLSKAFDSLDHKILFNKLNHYGIRGNALEWFKSYLSQRRQFVSISNVNSHYREVTCGVPQGSILGPLLFIICVNDLHRASSNLLVISYADDTNIFYWNPDINHLL